MQTSHLAEGVHGLASRRALLDFCKQASVGRRQIRAPGGQSQYPFGAPLTTPPLEQFQAQLVLPRDFTGGSTASRARITGDLQIASVTARDKSIPHPIQGVAAFWSTPPSKAVPQTFTATRRSKRPVLISPEVRARSPNETAAQHPACGKRKTLQPPSQFSSLHRPHFS